jgi:cell division protein FtsX
VSANELPMTRREWMDWLMITTIMLVCGIIGGFVGGLMVVIAQAAR